MAKMTGARALIECLKMEGIKYIFGNPGTTEVAILDELCECPEITYILTLQEGVAIGMADGFARGGGEIGVVNVHTAVGTANTIGGIYNASIDESPVLVAIANKDSRLLGRGCFCEVPDLPGMTRQFTKWSWEVRRPEKIVEDLLRGIKKATTIPRGPVFLSFSEDLLKEEIEVGELLSTRPKLSLSIRENEEAIQKAASLLVEATDPLLIAGNEVGRAGAIAETVELAELLAMPVVTEGRESLAAFNFPSRHYLFRGGFEPDAPHVKKADVILGLGCKMFVQTSYRALPDVPKGAKIIHLHSNPEELARIYPEEISVLCDVSKGIKALIAALKPLVDERKRKSFNRKMEQLRKEKEMQIEELEKEIGLHWNDVPIHLSRVVRELNTTLSRDAIIVDEAIRSSRALLRYYDFEVPGTFHRSSAGALGWGVPASLGIKLANPQRQVLAFVGDGSFLFTAQSLWTAARYNIAVIVVICNNRQYKAVKDGSLRYNRTAARTGNFIGCDIRDPDVDFEKIAQGFGVWARSVERPEQFKPALEEAIQLGRPALIDVRVA